jgi:hypothetical protein
MKTGPGYEFDYGRQQYEREYRQHEEMEERIITLIVRNVLRGVRHGAGSFRLADIIAQLD